MFLKFIKFFNLLLILILFQNKFFIKNIFFNNNINFIYNKSNYNKIILHDGNNNYNIFINLTYVKYCFSFTYNYAKVEYNLGFYDEHNHIISPSDLALYFNLSIICYITLFNEKKNIYSIASIVNNSLYNCIEFINLKEKIIFGIILYHNYENITYSGLSIFSEKIVNYKKECYLRDNIFNPLLLNKEYETFAQNMNNLNLKETLQLNNSYFKYPCSILKRNVVINEVDWRFLNIFNHYFCFCKGNDCLNINIPQKCKFYFYVNIINNNKNIYKKTDFLFIDFIFSDLSSDDVFPIFKEMEIRNYPVHYLTEKIEIYNEYSYKEKNKLAIILIKKDDYNKNGDFLEKYLSLFLKLKVVLSAKYTNFHMISILFYNIEYITYIAVGHGICYFKDYLFEDYRLYGRKKNNKILIPPSNKLISLAKIHGWKDEDIIKINLPRWDKYKIDEEKIFSSYNGTYKIKDNSIFMMFTWREMKRNEKISSLYINNIIKLLKNNELNIALKNTKIKLYFSLHRYMNQQYKKKIDILLNNNKFIKYINQNSISKCLTKSSLIISDFSSIIFDFIYRRKPYILYIPDINETQIKTVYTKDYYNIIESFKNNDFHFENIFFEIKETVNKIIYYIYNNFKLEKNMKKFYEAFNLKKSKSINEFINYLKNLN